MTIDLLASFGQELLILSLVVLFAFGLLMNGFVNLISFLLTQLIDATVKATKETLETLKHPRTFP